MNRITSKGLAGTFVWLALAVSACGSTVEVSSSPEGTEGQTLSERLSRLDSDLVSGAQGDSVIAVQDYLTAYGYFPNDKLGGEYPEWRPIVDESPTPGLFDEPTASAIRALQANMGLAVTGLVDEETRVVLKTARCGDPDGIRYLDPANKYAQEGSKWGTSSLTWKLTNTNDVTMTQARNAAAAAFAVWAAQTSLTFSEITGTGTADITINFGTVDGAGGNLSNGHFPSGGGDFTLDTAETWSVATPTPAGAFDLQTSMTHNIGHSLGLDHSSFSVSPMYRTLASATQNRTLAIDDDVGISTLYDVWESLPGAALDIGVSGDTAWIIGSNNTVFKWNPAVSNWTQATGSGIGSRIAVQSNGVPWMVDSLGTIFQRTTSSATTGSWTTRPGCAVDVGIGIDGSIWIVGCSPVPGGYGMFKWNGSSWTADAIGGGAIRIAVDSNGIPWITNTNGEIFRRTTSNPATGAWTIISGGANDIGVGPANYPFIIGTSSAFGGFNMFAREEQDGTNGSPVESTWVSLPGGATQISVGTNGRPWITNDVGLIFRALK